MTAEQRDAHEAALVFVRDPITRAAHVITIVIDTQALLKERFVCWTLLGVPTL